MKKGVLAVAGVVVALILILSRQPFFYQNSADYTAGSDASTPTANETIPSAHIATEAETETMPIEETSVPERVLSEAEIQFWGVNNPDLIAEAEPWVNVIDITDEDAACIKYRRDVEMRLNHPHISGEWFASTLEEEYALLTYHAYLMAFENEQIELDTFDIYCSILYKYEDEYGGGLLLVYAFSNSGRIAYSPLTGHRADAPDMYEDNWSYDNILDMVLNQGGNEQNRTA